MDADVLEFNGKQSDDAALGLEWQDWHRPILPETRDRLMEIFDKDGEIDYGGDLRGNRFRCEFRIVGDTRQQLRTRAREVAGWLNTGGALRRLIFGDEPDKFFMARPIDLTTFEDLITTGEGEVTFFVPDARAHATDLKQFLIESEGTFSRASTAYLLDGSSVESGDPRHEVDGTMVEEGTTNRLAEGDQDFSGWATHAGSSVTLTQNWKVDEWNADDATRIQTSGGTGEIKHYKLIESDYADGEPAANSVWVKNIGDKTVRVRNNLVGDGVPAGIGDVEPGESRRVKIVGKGDGSKFWQFCFEALDTADDLDFIAWQPQAEEKAYATSWHPTTRANETLIAPTLITPDADFTLEFKLPELTEIALTPRGGSYTHRIFHIARGIGGTGLMLGHRRTASGWRLSSRDDDDNVTDGFFADSITPAGSSPLFEVRYNANDDVLKCFVDNVERASISNPKLPSSFANTIAIGHLPGQVTSYLNTRHANVQQIQDGKTVVHSLINNLASGIANEGSAETSGLIEIEIDSSISELVVTQPETGEYLKLNRSLESGDIVVIDTAKELVTVNGVDAKADVVDLAARYFDLPPGLSGIDIDPEPEEATVKIRERWC